MKRIASILFGKLTLGVLAIFLQFFWIVYTIYGVTFANSAISVVFELVALFLSLQIANKEMRTSYKMSWIFLILFLPVFGITAYFLFGRAEITKGTRKKMVEVSNRFLPMRKEEEQVKKDIYSEDTYVGMQSDYITNYAGYPLYYNETSKYYGDIKALWYQLLQDLKEAKNYIFLEYFIIEEGKMFNEILTILEQKAKEGVLVRLIYDDMGCITTVSSHFDRMMRQKGIQCARFNPFRPMLSIIMNNRDHRKITVIDGKIAYTGGFNLADEYINEVERYGHWKDSGLRMTGEGVWNFVTMFLEMWDYITKENEDCEIYRYRKEEHQVPAKGYIQPYGDSPMDHEDVGETVYLNMITHARKEILIFTPYLILGTEMIKALVNAAKSGVDVKIVVPGIPDKKMVYMLTKANFAPLLRGGVKIYRYLPGFLHSKCFVVDDELAVVGTINLDYRSLFLHFECGVFLYRTTSVAEVKEDMCQTLAACRQVSLEETKENRFFVRLFHGALKLFAPLM